MDNNRKRKLDEASSERIITTLDIIDDYPILSKQLHASVDLRKLNIQEIILHTLNHNENLFDLLTNILRSNINTHFNEELEINVIEKDGNLYYNICDKGYKSLFEWYFLKGNQFSHFDRELHQHNNYQESLMMNNEREMWSVNNPRPISSDNFGFYNQIELYGDEIKRFVKLFCNIVNSFGVQFFIDDEVYHFDGFSFIASNRQIK